MNDSKKKAEKYSYGRKILYSSYTHEELNKETITEILNDVFPIHLFNRSEISYLENYVKRAIGNAPLLGVTYYAYKKDNSWIYKGSVYTETEYYDFEFSSTVVTKISN